MFAFLTRMGRVFVGITVFVAVLGVLGVMTTTGILVASHHNASSAATCSLSGTAVGAPLVLSGGGYSPNTTYSVDFLWPNGTTGGFGTTSNSSGSITVSTYAWWSGTYKAEVMSNGGNSHLIATCSATI